MKKLDDILRSAKVLVVGSCNTDMMVKAKHLPVPGETIIGEKFYMIPGGKGANQAVAIARLGGEVTFVCKTGNDIFGHQSQQLFEEEGIDISYILSDKTNPSGVALITVDEEAENCIVVASGANANLLPKDLKFIDPVIDASDIILMQLEIPMETVIYVAELAREKGKPVILNPAPAQDLPQRLLQCLSIITPNETEAQMISGVAITDEASAIKAAEVIAGMGVEKVIITLGSKGCLVYSEGIAELVSAYKVEAIDTTAAGDTFNGALAVALTERSNVVDAVRFACKAAAICVTRIGAQASVPYRTEVDIFNQ